MNKYQVTIISAVAFLVLAALGYFIIYEQKSTRFNWEESFKQGEKNPFDAYLVAELLDDYFPEKEFNALQEEELTSVLESSTQAPSNYVFIGNRLYLDSANMAALLNYVESGQTAFISANRIPTEFLKSLYVPYTEEEVYSDEELDSWSDDDDDWFYNEEEPENPAKISDFWGDFEYFRAKKAEVVFRHPSLNDSVHTIRFKYKGKERAYSWNYIQEYGFEDKDGYLPFEPLSDITLSEWTSGADFIRIPHGDGMVYLHVNPILFTNYQLVDESNLELAEKVFSHLPEGDIYWDEYSKTYRFPDLDNDRGFRESPLQYVLSQPSLKWSWYLMLTLGGLFIIFRAKRKQRIIPVLAENANTSMEFIHTVGRLYLQQGNHRKLVKQQMKLFLSFIRDHYSIPTHHQDEIMMKRISIKSEIPLNKVQSIFMQHDKLSKKRQVSPEELIQFNEQLEYFYGNSK